jgi:hypothetical protein
MLSIFATRTSGRPTVKAKHRWPELGLQMKVQSGAAISPVARDVATRTRRMRKSNAAEAVSTFRHFLATQCMCAHPLGCLIRIQNSKPPGHRGSTMAAPLRRQVHEWTNARRMSRKLPLVATISRVKRLSWLESLATCHSAIIISYARALRTAFAIATDHLGGTDCVFAQSASVRKPRLSKTEPPRYRVSAAD